MNNGATNFSQSYSNVSTFATTGSNSNNNNNNYGYAFQISPSTTISKYNNSGYSGLCPLGPLSQGGTFNTPKS